MGRKPNDSEGRISSPEQIDRDAGKHKIVGQALQKFRLEENLDQAAFADLAGVTKQTVEHWETGEKVFYFHDLLAVAEGLDLTVQEVTSRLVESVEAAKQGKPKPERKTVGVTR